MKNWYEHAMPTIKDVAPYVAEVAKTIKAVPGVQSVYVTGSYIHHADKPDYPIKDLDIIVSTDFDSGDLLAIDSGPAGPFAIRFDELEDFGFNPKAVKFTKTYTSLHNFNLDHWASSKDGKILHWGRIAGNIPEWQEVHDDAEKYAAKVTGYNRMKLAKKGEEPRRHWYEAFTHSVNKAVGSRKNQIGWYISDHPANEIIAAAQLLA